jgi:hypothetical protein
LSTDGIFALAGGPARVLASCACLADGSPRTAMSSPLPDGDWLRWRFTTTLSVSWATLPSRVLVTCRPP